MKKLIILFYLGLFASLNVIAKPILSGYNYDKRPVYFEDSSIVSYGKIVTGTIKSNRNEPEEGQHYSSEINYIYFCPFDSLENSSSRTIFTEPDGTYKNTTNFDLSEQTYPISLISNPELDDMGGLSGFRKKLKSKCSSVIKKLPRFEIPIVRSEVDIYHLTLDTIKTQGGIKSAWLKRRGIVGEVSKKADGTPYVIGGKEWKVYSFSPDAGYVRSEFQVDCKNQKHQTTQIIEYGPNGSTVTSNAFPLDVKNMSSIVPDSMGEDISKFMCSF